MKFNGWQTLVNKDLGYAPYFSSILRQRVHKKKACNIVVTGEPGEGKSYQSTDLCRVLEGLTASGKDRFSLDQIVFTYKDYLRLIVTLQMGKAIMFDEPSYAMGKREWYKDVNKVLVKTIESQRFKVHPLFIPIINKALLDKTIRSYLIQFQVEMRDRGKATVYRIYPSQHTEKIYRYTLCNLEYALFDNHLCSKDTCLGCEKIMFCGLFRARYEVKKATIQDNRYEQAFDEASTQESLVMTDKQVEDALFPLYEKYVNDKGKLDATLLRIVADGIGIKLGHNRSYRIKKALELHHPDKFV